MSGAPFPVAAERTRDWIQWMSTQRVDDVASDTCSQSQDDTEELKSIPDDSTLRARMSRLFNSRKFTDVKFTVKNSKKSQFSLEAHKAILANACPTFEEMLFGPASYSIPPNTMLEIEINNVTFDSFKNVVEYLYTDEIHFESESMVLDTLSAAKKFMIHPLMEKCEAYYNSRELFPQTVCSMLQLALSNKMEDLKNRCSRFIQENTSEALRSKAFLDINLSTVRWIFKLQQMNLVSESELFEAAMRWAATKEPGKAATRSQVDPFLKCIRFLTLAPKEFNLLMQRHSNILTAKEALDIMMYITSPGQGTKAPELPTWCNKETKSRCSFKEMRSIHASARDLKLVDREATLCIPLKPISESQKLDNLRSTLEMKCLRGRHQIRAIKLSFQGPVQEHGRIGMMSISINVWPSGFNFVELLRIEKSKDVLVTLTKSTLARVGDIVRIVAEASDIVNYQFLQYDTNCLPVVNSPFKCEIGSFPSWKRLYMISEVHYGPQFMPQRQK